jgi:hypothetical protein
MAANPAVDEVNDSRPPTDPVTRAQQYSLARKQAWLKQNQTAFNLFQTALKTPCLHPPVRSLTNVFPAYARLRELARDKKIESNAREMSGDWNGAMQSRLDTVQMGTDIGQGGPLIAALVGIAVQSIGRSEQWPIVEKLNATQCRAAITRLENIYGRRLKAADALQEELYTGQTEMLKLMRGPTWRILAPSAGVAGQGNVALSTRWRALTVSRRTIIDNYTRYMDVQIENARRPFNAAKKPLPSLNDPLSNIFAGPFNRASTNYARNDAGNALWLVSLALRAYRLENGAYPAQLKELVPRYLKQVPADPFGGGEALRYKRTGNEYLLYSIGPDGSDNGGRPVAYRKNATASARRQLPPVLPDSTGDYVAGKNR